MNGNLKPINREELLKLKSSLEKEQEREGERIDVEFVDKIVKNIYSAVIIKAKESRDELIYDLPNEDYYNIALLCETYNIPKSSLPYADLCALEKKFKIPKEIKYQPHIYMFNSKPTKIMKDIIDKLKNLFPDCSHNYGWKQDSLNRWVYYIIIKFK